MKNAGRFGQRKIKRSWDIPRTFEAEELGANVGLKRTLSDVRLRDANCRDFLSALPR